MSKGIIILEFRSENTDETRNYFIKEIEENKLMSNKHKKVYTTVNYFKHFLTLASSVSVTILLLYMALL